MQSVKTFDYIIVGQGLAGSCLALQLLARKKTVLVIDSQIDNHASRVAAGLFNPFTGKVMAKTWMADLLFPYLTDFYTKAEITLNAEFFYNREIYRPFISIHEQNGWMGKSADPLFASYIEKIFLAPSSLPVYDDFGGLLLKNTGYLDVPGFLDAVTAYLETTDSIRLERFNENELADTGAGIRYRDLSASSIIFCNGLECTKSRYFAWLPVNPLKGETIQVHFPQISCILNRGVYVVPTKVRNEYRVGATYDFASQEPGITIRGREELEQKLRELIKAPFKVTGQQWGMRPTTLDQKLMLGAHPELRNFIIFNGLGTKGVSFAPYFSGQLADWLIGKGEILREVNIERYKALYSKLL